MVFRSSPDLVGMREPHPRHNKLARIGECTGNGVDISRSPSRRLCMNQGADIRSGTLRDPW